MALTVERAQLANETKEDVFTEDGDAVTIAEVDPTTYAAWAVGANVGGRWWALDKLTAREEL